MTVDVAAHIVGFNIYFIVILIILNIVYFALKPLLQPCCCVYLRHLVLLCILYMYCSRLYCMRLLKVLFGFGERLLIVFALVHGHGYRFVWWRTDAVIQLLGVCAVWQSSCCLRGPMGSTSAMGSILKFFPRRQDCLLRYILFHSTLSSAVDTIRLWNRDVLSDLNRGCKGVLLYAWFNGKRIIPNIPLAADAQLFWVMVHHAAAPFLSPYNQERMVSSTRRKNIIRANRLSALELLFQILINLGS